MFSIFCCELNRDYKSLHSVLFTFYIVLVILVKGCIWIRNIEIHMNYETCHRWVMMVICLLYKSDGNYLQAFAKLTISCQSESDRSPCIAWLPRGWGCCVLNLWETRWSLQVPAIGNWMWRIQCNHWENTDFCGTETLCIMRAASKSVQQLLQSTLYYRVPKTYTIM